MADDVVTPYRVPAPHVDHIVAWPAAFGTRFMVHVDVEEEFDWRAPLDPAHRATTAMAAFPAAHRRFADRGIALTSFVDHPVVSDPVAVEILARTIEDGRSAIGAQLHTWVTPPFAARTRGDSYAGNLPHAVEAAKLDTLTDALAAAFGAPLAFRSGRYGIGAATIALLVERGYRIDSSVRAHYDYRGDGGPDFRAVGSAAYRVGNLVELPLTVVFTGALRHRGARLYDLAGHVPRARGVLARAGLLERVALTPEDMPIDEAVRAVTAAVNDGMRLLNFSFHSPSLVPGHTPYVRTPDDLARFWRWWDRMFTHLDALGVAPASLAEVIAASAV